MCAGPKPEDGKHRLRFFKRNKYFWLLVSDDIFAWTVLNTAKQRAEGFI